MQYIIFSCFIIYVAMMFVITWITARKATNASFFVGNRKSPWFVVAYGMIGTDIKVTPESEAPIIP